MDKQVAEAILFVAASVSAGLAAFRDDFFPKVKKLALAVSLVALAFLIQVTDFLKA